MLITVVHAGCSVAMGMAWAPSSCFLFCVGLGKALFSLLLLLPFIGPTHWLLVLLCFAVCADTWLLVVPLPFPLTASVGPCLA